MTTDTATGMQTLIQLGELQEKERRRIPRIYAVFWKHMPETVVFVGAPSRGKAKVGIYRMVADCWPAEFTDMVAYRRDDLDRLMKHVNWKPGFCECWIWTGCKCRDGYGQIKYEGRKQKAHRVAYRLFFGALRSDLEIDHVCRNRACVNPEHLKPVKGITNKRLVFARRPA